MEEWGLERLQGLRSVNWRPDARSVGVGKSKPLVASHVCLGVQPQLAPLHPPAPSAPELSAPALSDLRDDSSRSLPLSLTEYISRSVHIPRLTPPLSPSRLLSPQAARPSFDFPINPGYGAWKWLDPIIIVVWERPEVIQIEIVTVWDVLGDASGVKLWLSSCF